MIHQVIHALPNQNEDFSGDYCLRSVFQTKVAFLEVSNVTKNSKRVCEMVNVDAVPKSYVVCIADQIIEFVYVKWAVDYFGNES